ncbi:MAG: hypothetical protein NTY07_13170 [Bacteroidia bacterium]|nr:hypothetical protein [Bacteroidia bacterium]
MKKKFKILLFVLGLSTLIVSCGKKSSWEVKDALDGSGNKIKGQLFIGGVFKGTMTNSVISGAATEVWMLIERSNYSGGFSLSTTFFDYDKNQARLGVFQLIYLKVEKESGEIVNVTQLSYDNYAKDPQSPNLLDILLSEKTPLKITVDLSKVSGYETTVYNFEVDPKGLADLINKNS